VLFTILDQVVPLLADLSIMYPVMAEPPLFDGAVHDRLIRDDDIVVAVRPVGGCGAVAALADKSNTKGNTKRNRMLNSKREW